MSQTSLSDAHERRATRRPLQTIPLEPELLSAAAERAERDRVCTLFRPSPAATRSSEALS